MNRDFYTAEEVAEKLDVTPAYVEHLLTTGKLNGRKLGSEDWQVSKAELATFIKRQ